VQNKRKIIFAIRLAVTGHEHGADLAKIMAAIGKEEIIKRIEEHLN
jgi:glutamyl/glutaminyl-tRNA synthetase